MPDCWARRCSLNRRKAAAKVIVNGRRNADLAKAKVAAIGARATVKVAANAGRVTAEADRVIVALVMAKAVPVTVVLADPVDSAAAASDRHRIHS